MQQRPPGCSRGPGMEQRPQMQQRPPRCGRGPGVQQRPRDAAETPGCSRDPGVQQARRKEGVKLRQREGSTWPPRPGTLGLILGPS